MKTVRAILIFHDEITEDEKNKLVDKATDISFSADGDNQVVFVHKPNPLRCYVGYHKLIVDFIDSFHERARLKIFY